MKFLVAQCIYLICSSTLALGVVVNPGATIVGPGEPSTLVKGPSSKATVKGPSGPLIVSSGDTGAITSAGKVGGVVSESQQVAGSISPVLSEVPLVAPAPIPAAIEIPISPEVVPVAAYASSEYRALPYEQYGVRATPADHIYY